MERARCSQQRHLLPEGRQFELAREIQVNLAGAKAQVDRSFQSHLDRVDCLDVDSATEADVKTVRLVGFGHGLAVGAGILGAAILAHQGTSVVRRTQQALAQGRPPVAPVLDGVFQVLAGVLLITPGFLSDVLALLLLIPPVRRGLARWCVK